MMNSYPPPLHRHHFYHSQHFHHNHHPHHSSYLITNHQQHYPAEDEVYGYNANNYKNSNNDRSPVDGVDYEPHGYPTSYNGGAISNRWESSANWNAATSYDPQVNNQSHNHQRDTESVLSSPSLSSSTEGREQSSLEEEVVDTQHPQQQQGRNNTNSYTQMNHHHPSSRQNSVPVKNNKVYTTNSPSAGFLRAKFTLSSMIQKASFSGVEEEERKRRRRERNKVAATKCRHKKKEHVVQLNVESEKLQESNSLLRTTLRELEDESIRLSNLLDTHRPYCILTAVGNKSSRFNNNNADHHLHHHHQLQQQSHQQQEQLHHEHQPQQHYDHHNHHNHPQLCEW